jgi:hypothetical protein
LAKANLTERDSRSQKCSSSVPASAIGTSFSLDSDDPLELAKNPSVPASFLSKLVNSPSQKVRTALAANPSLGVEGVQALAFDSNDSVRCELAKRTDLPAQVMRALAADRSRFVRRNLADNPSCNDEAFKRLVSDNDVYVRERVAKHPSLSYRACSWILADTEARVQLALADNPNAPASAFISARDEYYLESLLGEKPSALKALLLLSPNLPKPKLDGVNVAPDPAIRLALALCPYSSTSTLQGLQDDEEPDIRKTATSRLAIG